MKTTLLRLEPVLGQTSRELDQVSKDVSDMRSKDLVDLEVSVAKLQGRVSQLPKGVQLLGSVLAIAGVTRFMTGP